MPSWEDGSASCGAGLLPVLPSKGRWCGCGARGESGPWTVWIAGDKDRGLWSRSLISEMHVLKKKKKKCTSFPPPTGQVSVSSYNHYVLEHLPIELSNFPYLPPPRVLSHTVTPAGCASECVLGLLGAPYPRAVGAPAGETDRRSLGGGHRGGGARAQGVRTACVTQGLCVSQRCATLPEVRDSVCHFGVHGAVWRLAQLECTTGAYWW